MGDNRVTDRNRLSIVRPDLASEWSHKNLLSLDKVAINCAKRVWWICSKCKFEWECKVSIRNNYIPTGKNGATHIHKYPAFCPCCASKISKNAKLMAEWNWKMNTIHPYFVAGKVLRVWWICEDCKFEWKDWAANRILGIGGSCPRCNSIEVLYPHIAKEFSPKNNSKPCDVSYGSNEKVLWKCSCCNNEWSAAVGNRTIGGAGCPRCSRIKLKDGTIWDSKAEAYYYICLISLGEKFVIKKKYDGLKKHICDFYLIDKDEYVEVTSFHKNSRNINYYDYLRNIVKKKKYVNDNLKSKFKFVQIKYGRKEQNELMKWV